MPSNKNAAFRYRVLNDCFTRPGRRRWTEKELHEEVTRQLQEHFGDRMSISRRAIQGDIALMRSDPPRGFGAPIVVKEGKYFYDDPDFTISRFPLSLGETALLRDAFALLRQFPGLPQLPVLEALVRQSVAGMDLELPNQSVIQFENSPPAMGLSWLEPLYGHIRRREALEVRYQPFAPPGEVVVVLHPYLLKEWRNRWYVVGRNESENQVWNLALDRIADVRPAGIPFRPNDLFDPIGWYLDIVGVTRPQGAVPVRIKFRASAAVAGYILTKPIHTSQQTVRKEPSGSMTFSLRVIPNPELIGELRRFGPEVEVLSPESVKKDFFS